MDETIPTFHNLQIDTFDFLMDILNIMTQNQPPPHFWDFKKGDIDPNKDHLHFSNPNINKKQPRNPLMQNHLT